MKIAVTAETDRGLDSPVAQHFGHAPYFVLVDVDAERVVGVASQANPFAEAHQPGQIPSYLHGLGVDAIVSGGMGGRAIQFFAELGIEAATGVAGTVAEVVERVIAGGIGGAAPCDESVAHGHG